MINPFDIMKSVEEYYHLPRGSICSKKRSRTRVEARHAAMYLCRVFTSYSLTEIGEFFERKDHTTVLNAINNMRTTKDTHIKNNLTILSNSIRNMVYNINKEANN